MKSFVKMLMVAVGVAAVLASSANASEVSSIKFPGGNFAINPATCKFVHPETDYPLGMTWSVGKIAFAYEDRRHDVKLSCLTNKLNSRSVGAPGPRGPQGPAGPAGPTGPAGPAGGLAGYVRVSAAINFKQASASVSCPTGKVVLGGGATVEAEGSYPSSDTTWTVTRDNMWGHFKTGTVYATCADVVS